MSRYRKAAMILMALVCFRAQALDAGTTFRDDQNRYSRVRAARITAQPRLEEFFRQAGLRYPAREIFLRAFKMEGEFELWARNNAGSPYTLVRTYLICAASGTVGPKRREGDLQVPEGFYHIGGFNPWSRFHLSLRVDYPNASDRLLGDPRSPGGDIFIHGSCVTIGCIPLRDGPIEEVYLAAVDARHAGQARIPVHIFPCRLDRDWLRLEREAWRRPELLEFWRNLQEGYAIFENTLRVPKVTVDRSGKYVFSEN